MTESESLEKKVEERVDEYGTRLLELVEDIEGYFEEVEWDGYSEWEISPEGVNIRTQLLAEYESIYSGTRPLIKDYLPDRLDEYDSHHHKTISRIRGEGEDLGSDPKYWKSKITTRIQSQYAILHSITSRVEMEELRARKTVSRAITTSEIEKATSLFEDGDTRAAGVVAGVSLERHLQSLCEMEGLEYDPMAGISSLATTLNTENRINDDEFRLLEHLGGLRNKCSHASEEEPTSGEVDRLINETKGFVSESGIR